MSLNQWAPILVWAGALALFAVVEGLTVNLTSIWFALGALCALIVSVFTSSWIVQVLVFLAVSLLALGLLRPLSRRRLSTRQEPTNADRVIGAEAVVTEEIDALHGHGAVRIGAAEWTARAEDETIISAGERVRVLRIEGVKVIVVPTAAPCGAEKEK